jgi:hypothetical protein
MMIGQGMNHVLKHAPDTSSQAAIIAGYTDPKLQIDRDVVMAVAITAKVSGSPNLLAPPHF